MPQQTHLAIGLDPLLTLSLSNSAVSLLHGADSGPALLLVRQLLSGVSSEVWRVGNVCILFTVKDIWSSRFSAFFFFYTTEFVLAEHTLFKKKKKKNPLLNDYHSGNIAQAKRHYYVLTQVLEFPILPCDSTIWSLSTGWFANLFGVDTRISGLDQEVVPLVYVMCLPHEVMVNLQACEDGSQKRFTSAKLTSWQARRSFPGTEYRHLVYHR